MPYCCIPACENGSAKEIRNRQGKKGPSFFKVTKVNYNSLKGYDEHSFYNTSPAPFPQENLKLQCLQRIREGRHNLHKIIT